MTKSILQTNVRLIICYGDKYIQKHKQIYHNNLNEIVNSLENINVNINSADDIKNVRIVKNLNLL